MANFQATYEMFSADEVALIAKLAKMHAECLDAADPAAATARAIISKITVTETPSNVFIVGQTYTDRAASDWDTVYRYKIVARTEKTLTIEQHGKTFKRGIRVHQGVETCRPDGSYSMCPFIRADRMGES